MSRRTARVPSSRATGNWWSASPKGAVHIPRWISCAPRRWCTPSTAPTAASLILAPIRSNLWTSKLSTSRPPPSMPRWLPDTPSSCPRCRGGSQTLPCRALARRRSRCTAGTSGHGTRTHKTSPRARRHPRRHRPLCWDASSTCTRPAISHSSCRTRPIIHRHGASMGALLPGKTHRGVMESRTPTRGWSMARRASAATASGGTAALRWRIAT
mmetsp:Transcript_25594/g.77181  ORF Transcript_25594/g.77181 Transcript_25594/m.77181 type:complete len:213 (-) Transcript_25594:63-701(-)